MRFILPTMRSMRIKFFAASLIILAIYLFLFYLVVEVWYIGKHSPSVLTSVVLPYVVVHIDMKGAPPKLEYLESLLPMLKEHGVNGLLLEYEDMFPYNKMLSGLSAKNCYNRSELAKFVKSATDSGFEVIPLIQTFGHLEYALKLKEYKHLREVSVYPDSICPSRIETRVLISHMIQQVLDFHFDIIPLKYIHVGLDEVFHINKCEQCSARELSNVNMYIEYVKFLSEVVSDKSHHTTLLIWDDMLRKIKQDEWSKYNIQNNVEPVYWDYKPTPGVSHLNLLNYHRTFKNIWIASAFKGADGRVATLPNIKNRFLNNFNWIKLILDYKFGGENQIYNFQGIILTGWSRYSHMDPLCELLPAAIPSLVLNLLLIKKLKTGIVASEEDKAYIDKFFTKYIKNDINESLKCKKDINTDNFETINCDFESSRLYNVLKQYELIKTDIASGFNNDETALSSIEYYASKKFVNLNTLMEHIDWCNNTLNELKNVEVMLRQNMEKYYKRDVIDEYVNYKTYSAKKKLKAILNLLKVYMHTRLWETKPFEGNVTEL